MIMIY